MSCISVECFIHPPRIAGLLIWLKVMFEPQISGWTGLGIVAIHSEVHVISLRESKYWYANTSKTGLILAGSHQILLYNKTRPVLRRSYERWIIDTVAIKGICVNATTYPHGVTSRNWLSNSQLHQGIRDIDRDLMGTYY
ncbi:hypothetical protein Moror_11338 [Moniliophthora roreri MCA 2997]|uniref:Uncharacterized protein n=1 Tax=Moniliophthora roreri (strain MCA 2997) TaxID=1381753 RepID=V2Y0W8_MONRO|nr:hypothetical protein Moror_11338 [Moniliophthora roreri MCA 2997]KAI3609935.1 hypothetical protein WG66_007637 [Moniliophthora roreri]